MKSLVIVESPAKAKTINKYLGSNYIVRSSVGHIRDLDKFDKPKESQDKEKKKYYKLVQQMGVDPENNWEAHYGIIKGKKKVIDELKKYAKTSDLVYLASDLDREGEAIAWHLKEILGLDETRYHRVIFNEITKNAIEEAFKNPIKLDMDRVHSQQARRYLDRVVGYMLSPLLWKKIARGLSAGRVQSVALRLIAEKEKEISKFISDEYWDMDVNLKFKDNDYLFAFKKLDGKDVNIPSEDKVKEYKSFFDKKEYIITKREEKQTKLRPTPPFITSTLQQASSIKLGFGVKKTMMLAQRLYEAGHITYMRTDSTNISREALGSCRDYIANHIGENYLPPSPNYYKKNKNAQEAHEAIRPSDVMTPSSKLSDLGRDGQNLYNLIRDKFISSQMKEAIYIGTTLHIDIQGHLLSATGRITLFDGFTKVYRGKRQEDTEFDKDMKEGCQLDFDKWKTKQKFTKPPARYNEASLVKELEKKGIGRPSTYASIISTLEDRGYVKIESKRFFLQKIGEIVVNSLKGSFVNLMSYDFTAKMEENLDEISEGGKKWNKVLDDFYYPFKDLVAEALSDDGMIENNPTLTDIPCETCKTGKMKIRTASTGVFLSCSNYDLPSIKDRCKATVNLISGSEATVSDEIEHKELREARLCPICHRKMDPFLMNEKTKIHICSDNPNCPGYELEKGEFKIKGYDGPTLECDKCGSEMQLKVGRFGKYFGCTSCKNTRKLLRNGQVAKVKMDPVPMPDIRCEKVDDFYFLRSGERGLFLVASQFPKKREIRAVYVDELVQYRDQIPEKYQFLTSAPLTDNKGNRAVVKYDRKREEQYVASEKNSKATGWKRYYIDDKWQE